MKNTPPIYLLLNGEPAGPYTAESVRVMWEAKAVNGLTQCCPEGSSQWVPLRNFAEDIGITPAAPRHARPLVSDAARAHVSAMESGGAYPMAPAPARRSGCAVAAGVFLALGGLFVFLVALLGSAIPFVGIIGIPVMVVAAVVCLGGILLAVLA